MDPSDWTREVRELQQCLPLAVLKPGVLSILNVNAFAVATVLTACGIETRSNRYLCLVGKTRCNSAYRLRY